MLTRRKFVTGAIAAGVLLRTEAGSAKAAEPFTASVHGEPATPVNFEIPPHACDCHTHFYGDPKVFPLSPAHLYTPETFHPEDMSALHRALHMGRVVIVTPSVYGPNNNGSTLFGVKARGATARGVPHPRTYGCFPRVFNRFERQPRLPGRRARCLRRTRACSLGIYRIAYYPRRTNSSNRSSMRRCNFPRRPFAWQVAGTQYPAPEICKTMGTPLRIMYPRFSESQLEIKTTRTRGVAWDMARTLLEPENANYPGTGGVSENNRCMGFEPAFIDREKEKRQLPNPKRARFVASSSILSGCISIATRHLPQWMPPSVHALTDRSTAWE